MNLPVSSTATVRNTVTPPRDYCDRDNMNAFLYAIGHGYGFYAACTYANVDQEAVWDALDSGLTSLGTEQAHFVELFQAAIARSRRRALSLRPWIGAATVLGTSPKERPSATPIDHEQYLLHLAHEARLS